MNEKLQSQKQNSHMHGQTFCIVWDRMMTDLPWKEVCLIAGGISSQKGRQALLLYGCGLEDHPEPYRTQHTGLI